MSRIATLTVALVALTLIIAHSDSPVEAAVFEVDTTTDDGSLDDCTGAAGDCSLRGAINAANAAAGHDTIVLANGQTYMLTQPTLDEDANVGGDLDITDNLKIEGGGSTIQQTLADRVMDAFPAGGAGKNLSLEAMTITGGNTTANGGGVRVQDAAFDMEFVQVTDNLANESGGGVALEGGVEATIMDSFFFQNTGAINAISAGGGLSFRNFEGEQGFLHITNSEFNDNEGWQGGAGIGFFAQTAEFTMTNTDLTLNDTKLAFGPGGGLWTQGGRVTIIGGTIDKNSADGYGGGMYMNSPGLVRAVAFDDNGALGAGGLYAVDVNSDILLDRLTITNNDATSIGGGALIDRLRMTNTFVSFNTAGDHGGGIMADSPSFTIDHSTISSNEAKTGDGGGLFIPSGGGVIENVSMTANLAHDSGGGIYVGEPTGFESLDWPPAPIFVNFTTIAANGALVGAANAQDVESNSALHFLQSIVSYSGLQPNCNAQMSSSGNNVEDTNTCGFSEPGDRPNMDPLLGGLADNGGPTLTMKLQAGSPAIDVGGNCPPPLDDQRGYVRDAGFGCDAGAYEANAAPATPSPTPSPTPTPAPTGPIERIWGDADCDGDVDADDALAVLVHQAGLDPGVPGGCPLGATVTVDGAERTWGDFDCDGTYSPGDALPALAFAAETPIAPPSGCPEIGEPVLVVT